MDFVQALIQEIGAIETKAKVPSNPGSCPICNDCEGWEGKTTKAKGNTLTVDKWPSPPFRLETNIQKLISSADSGCPTCGIFRDAVAHFRPTLEDNVEVEAWLPLRGLLPQLRIKVDGMSGDGGGDHFEFLTTQGITTPSS
jgi:hypothetical protein